MKIIDIENNFLRKTAVVLACLIYVPVTAVGAFVWGGATYLAGACIPLPDAVKEAWNGR
jgi:hypothetical protein